MKRFVFTPENIIANIDRLGAWSAYGLASVALQHYFPKEYDENGDCSTRREMELAEKLKCKYWRDVIIKYQTEIGYNAPNGFNPEQVNEY